MDGHHSQPAPMTMAKTSATTPSLMLARSSGSSRRRCDMVRAPGARIRPPRHYGVFVNDIIVVALRCRSLPINVPTNRGALTTPRRARRPGRARARGARHRARTSASARRAARSCAVGRSNGNALACDHAAPAFWMRRCECYVSSSSAWAPCSASSFSPCSMLSSTLRSFSRCRGLRSRGLSTTWACLCSWAIVPWCST